MNFSAGVYDMISRESAVAKWESDSFETEGPRVRASLASLHCVLEQDIFILA